MILLAGLVALACERPPSDDAVKEWTPTDHDRKEEAARARSGMQTAPPAPQGDGGKDDSALIELTWRQRCAVCHGMEGHGDGPNGPMVKAPDLTRADWQAKTNDAEIAATIQNGKNLMPRFDLPEKVVQGLVVRIRASRGQ